MPFFSWPNNQEAFPDYGFIMGKQEEEENEEERNRKRKPLKPMKQSPAMPQKVKDH